MGIPWSYQSIPWRVTIGVMKVGVSLPDDLVAFADEEATRRGTSRSAFLADLLRAEQFRELLSRYLNRYGWDVAEDDSAWREYQRQRMAAEYGDDDW